MDKWLKFWDGVAGRMADSAKADCTGLSMVGLMFFGVPFILLMVGVPMIIKYQWEKHKHKMFPEKYPLQEEEDEEADADEFWRDFGTWN